jgi:hypothetical protein
LAGCAIESPSASEDANDEGSALADDSDLQEMALPPKDDPVPEPDKGGAGESAVLSSCFNALAPTHTDTVSCYSGLITVKRKYQDSLSGPPYTSCVWSEVTSSGSAQSLCAWVRKNGVDYGLECDNNVTLVKSNPVLLSGWQGGGGSARGQWNGYLYCSAP